MVNMVQVVPNKRAKYSGARPHFNVLAIQHIAVAGQVRSPSPPVLQCAVGCCSVLQLVVDCQI